MRNTQGEETYVEKNLQLQNESTGICCNFNVRILYIPSSREIDLSRAICEVHSRGLQIQHSRFFYEDIQRCTYMYIGTYPFVSPVLIKYQNFPNPVIKLRYKKIHQPQPQKMSKSQRFESSRKTKERTIGQVRQYVLRWKQLHRKVGQRGKKLYTLQSAARQIGINKKTLDDYSHQIAKGEYFSFDFQKYKYQKIGFLRQFIKQKNEELKLLQNTDNYWALSESDEEKRRNSDSD